MVGYRVEGELPAAEPDAATLLRPTRAQRRKSRVVIVDDDPVFCEVMEHVAVRHGMLVQSYESLDEIDFAVLKNADVVIVDYHLGQSHSGLCLGRRLADETPTVPVLLVSAGQEAFQEGGWSENIRGFTSKSLGPFEVLGSALRLVKRLRDQDASM